MKVVGQAKPGFIASTRICKQLDSGRPTDARGFASIFPTIHRSTAELFHSSSTCGSNSESGGESFSCKHPEASASDFDRLFHRTARDVEPATPPLAVGLHG